MEEQQQGVDDGASQQEGQAEPVAGPIMDDVYEHGGITFSPFKVSCVGDRRKQQASELISSVDLPTLKG